MLLNQTVEYALRAAAVMAALPPGASITAASMSQRTGIPAQYVAKVMRRLVVGGIARSRRGQGGGFVLARAPQAIPLLDVLAAADLELEQEHCGFGLPQCGSQDSCPLHPVMAPLKDALRAWATGHTLADCVAKRP